MLKTIGETSEETGLTIDTLRYYEKIGLIDNIERNASGRRCYSDDDIGWINLLLCLKGTGMSIADMQCFAELLRGSEENIPDRIKLLQDHKTAVLAHISQMRERLLAIDNKIDIYLSKVKDKHQREGEA